MKSGALPPAEVERGHVGRGVRPPWHVGRCGEGEHGEVLGRRGVKAGAERARRERRSAYFDFLNIC